MKRIIIDGGYYWYNREKLQLCYDKGGKKPVPLAIFNVSQYQQFLTELQKHKL